jgi:outer membrane protein OmpA-like peptidoglycan-associated protein
MKKALFFILFALLLIATSDSKAQFRNYGVKGGVQFQPLVPFSEFDSKFSWQARGFVDIELSNTLALELGAGYGQFNTEDNFNKQDVDTLGSREVNTDIIPIDARLKVTPWSNTKGSWNPYFFIGAGLMNYNVKETPTTEVSPQYSEKASDWTGFIPVGIGTEVKLSKNVLLDLNAGFNYTFTDLLNNFVIDDYNDCYLNGTVGLMLAGGEDCTIDTDKDGITDCEEEKKPCLDPLKADTDGDGLNDGAELNTYSTDPCNKDTDSDGLLDGQEVNTYKTNPLMKDTDGEGLLDYDEVTTHKTDPLDTDTDNDNLNDYAEVKTHKTNPLNPDTDGGSVYDGEEVTRGTDPLVAADDVVKKEEPKVKVGQTITLEGINFATNSAEITSVAEEKLELALSTLKNHPDVTVEISGHTDNTGGRAHNEKLSLRRAESVKDWFVSKGIDASRITTVGYAWDKPVDTNDTPEGRFKNRRIDFTRTK